VCPTYLCYLKLQQESSEKILQSEEERILQALQLKLHRAQQSASPFITHCFENFSNKDEEKSIISFHFHQYEELLHI